MRTLGIDIETYSEIDIQKCGSFRYIDDPSFEILLFAYSWDSAPAEVVDLTVCRDLPWCGLPADVYEALFDPTVIKTGWNNAFERYALWKYTDRYLPPEQWEDTMVLAAQCGLPLSLGACCDALKMGEDQAKMKVGKQLIQYFCRPCKATKANGGRTRNYPEHDLDKWELFKKYNARDVDTEGLIRKMLIRFKPLDIEHQFWCLDARINERGVRCDLQLANQAIRLDEENKARLLERAAELSGLENPNSPSQIKAWLEEKEGIEVKSLEKKVIGDVMDKLTLPETKEFLNLRKQIAKSSVSKYDAMVRSASPTDAHIRGCFQFYGANRTGRFAGRLVQFQNLPQNHLPDLEYARDLVKAGDADTINLLFDGVSPTLSELIRTALIPEPGHRFIVSDFSAIEARVIAWIAGEEHSLQTFRDGGDIYCAVASMMFGKPVVKHGVNGELRQKGKVAVLACIAEGQLVLTDKGYVPIQDVDLDMKVWDGHDWVKHEGVVQRGRKPVIWHDGLLGTPDHLVYAFDRTGHVILTSLGAAKGMDLSLFPSGKGQAFPKPVSIPKVMPVYDILNAGPRHAFTVSNRLVHNCGYGGGVSALEAFGASKMGMTPEEEQDTVDRWRAANPHVCELWRVLEKAAIRSITHNTTVRLPQYHGVAFSMESGILWMTLPSGRRIAYWGARYDESYWRDGRRAISYMAQDQQTKKWVRTETWGGKLVENLVQATARDVLRDKMLEMERQGFDIRAHVHDEVIITEPIDGRPLEAVNAIMDQPASWAPGLPLRGDGYYCKFYMKD